MHYFIGILVKEGVNRWRSAAADHVSDDLIALPKTNLTTRNRN